jgi:hypothetical protein
MPSFSSSLSCWISIFWFTPATRFSSSEKRTGALAAKSWTMMTIELARFV